MWEEHALSLQSSQNPDEDQKVLSDYGINQTVVRGKNKRFQTRQRLKKKQEQRIRDCSASYADMTFHDIVK